MRVKKKLEIIKQYCWPPYAHINNIVWSVYAATIAQDWKVIDPSASWPRLAYKWVAGVLTKLSLALV